MDDYVPPQVDEEAFHCPYCDTFAHHSWQDLKISSRKGRFQILDGRVGACARCGDYHIWVADEMIYPQASSAPKPADDMPDEVREDFNEARQAVDDSPKAAAALLRLAMEKLVQELSGDDNQDLYNGIGELVKEGRIDERIQKALDSVRVTGNDYVHAGKIYSPDDRDTALRLFELVNVIVEVTIARENMIEEAYNEIPENKMDGIEQRDGT
jgi:hypothetical protein